MGCGVINFASLLAKNGAKYTDGSGNAYQNTETFEAIQVLLSIKAYQIEFMPKRNLWDQCPAFDETNNLYILKVSYTKYDLLYKNISVNDYVCIEPLRFQIGDIR